MFFSGYTKVLVGIGYAPNGGTTNNFEIIDLQTPSSKCNNVPGYSHSVYGSMAILGIDEKPIVCGGQSGVLSNCYTIGSNWQSLPSMKNVLAHGQFAPSPFVNKTYDFIMTGGANG